MQTNKVFNILTKSQNVLIYLLYLNLKYITFINITLLIIFILIKSYGLVIFKN